MSIFENVPPKNVNSMYYYYIQFFVSCKLNSLLETFILHIVLEFDFII